MFEKFLNELKHALLQYGKVSRRFLPKFIKRT